MSGEGGWRVEPGSTHTPVSGGGGGAVCSPSVLAIMIQQPQRTRPGSWWLLLTWGQEINSYVIVWMMFKRLGFQMRAPTARKGGQGAQGGRRTCAQVWGLPCRRAVAGRVEREVGRSSLLGEVVQRSGGGALCAPCCRGACAGAARWWGQGSSQLLGAWALCAQSLSSPCLQSFKDSLLGLSVNLQRSDPSVTLTP